MRRVPDRPDHPFTGRTDFHRPTRTHGDGGRRRPEPADDPYEEIYESDEEGGIMT